MTKQQLREAIRKIIKQELNESAKINTTDKFDIIKRNGERIKGVKFIDMRTYIINGVEKNLNDNDSVEKSTLNENKQYQKGDIVIPNKGPHKGEKHKVIHVNDDGTVNIQPISSKKVQYRLGAVKAKPEDLSEGPYENQPSQTPSKPKTEPAVHPGKPSTDKPNPRRPLGNPEVKPGPKALKATMKEAEMLKQVIKRFKSKK